MRLRAPVPGGSLADIEIMKGIHQKAFYQGLYVCARVWHCPVCAAKISERRRVELKAALHEAGARGMRAHFVTLTVPHGVGDNLQELLGRLSDALKRLSCGKHAIKGTIERDLPGEVLHGYIRALEVTHGQNGFHPHFHLILFTSKGVDPLFLEGAYRAAWQRACRLAGLPVPSWEHGVTVQDGSKAGEYASKWGLEDEMTKAHMKQTRRKGLPLGACCGPFLMAMTPTIPRAGYGSLQGLCRSVRRSPATLLEQRPSIVVTDIKRAVRRGACQQGGG